MTHTTENNKEVLRTVRVSGYGDYIALDFIEDGKIVSTPFYIREGEQIEVHWATPSNERMSHPVTYQDYHDFYSFKMENGELFVNWLNGPCMGMGGYSKLNPKDLIDWKFQFASKILPATAINNAKTII